MKQTIVSIVTALACCISAHAKDRTSWDNATRSVNVQATDFTLSSPAQQTKLRSYARDNIPFTLNNMRMFTQDRHKIPMNASWGNGGQCWTLEAKSDLPKWGQDGSRTIYKLTEYVGVYIEAGDGYGNNRNIPSSQWTDVFPGGYCTSGDAGAAAEAWPVLIKQPKNGQKLNVPRTKIASMKIIKPSYLPQRRTSWTSWMNGFTGFTGKPEWDIWMPAFSLVMQDQTCTLSSAKDLTLNLPTIAMQSIPRQGKETYGGKFKISLHCPNATDDNGKRLVAFMTLTDQSDPSNVTDILSLSPESTATGVGIRLYKEQETTPLKYGAASSQKGNQNQWQFSKRAGEERPTVNFRAYYVNKTGNLSPGTVKAIAIYTLSYQ